MKGSILDADHPDMGVNFARRSTRLAMLQTALSELMSTGVVLHPADWASIELLKDTTGQFIIGNPQGNLSPTLW